MCVIRCTVSVLSILVLSPNTLAQAADHEGRPFIAQRAPDLTFRRQSAPRPGGIDYPFAEQTSRGAALFDRFPQFKLRDRRVHVSGPWYNSFEANGHFTHGITSVEAMPRFREGPSDIRKIPNSQKWMLLTDPFWWGHAQRLADHLAKSDPNDPRIAPLRTFGKDHRITKNKPAYIELGRWAWTNERAAVDEKQEGFVYAMIDIECSEGWENQRDCFGWLYQGLCEAAGRQGVKLVPVTYGQWTFCVGAVHESMRQGGKGDPEFLLPERDFLASPDPTLKAVNANHGVISMDGYLQAMWGPEPFYKRKPDGSLIVVDGKPVFSDITKTTLYGIDFRLEKGEAELCLQNLYRQAIRMYLMYHRLAGEYPADSTMRKPFLQNARIGAWSRITNEGLQGIEQNDRPLPGWEIELLMGMYLMTADDIVIWSSDTNVPPGPLGADYSKYWKYNAHGVVEHAVKALHRYSALDPIHNGDFKWCWFTLPMVNKNQSDGDRYDQKPLVFAKIRTFENRPWIELFAAWPALDNNPADLKLWIDKGGTRSPAYTVRLKDGRSYFYDAWRLPADFKDIEGKDVWLRFTDQLGVTRTWRGDWREKVDQNLPTPAAYTGQ